LFICYKEYLLVGAKKCWNEETFFFLRLKLKKRNFDKNCRSAIGNFERYLSTKRSFFNCSKLVSTVDIKNEIFLTFFTFFPKNASFFTPVYHFPDFKNQLFFHCSIFPNDIFNFQGPMLQNVFVCNLRISVIN